MPSLTGCTDHRHHRASSCGGVSLHPRCGGLPGPDHQLFHRHRPLLAPVPQAECTASVQGFVLIAFCAGFDRTDYRCDSLAACRGILLGGLRLPYVLDLNFPSCLSPSDLAPAVLVAPFLKPANKVGDTPPLPYYLYVVFAIATLSPNLTSRSPGTALWASRSWPSASSTGRSGASCRGGSGTTSCRARRSSATALSSLWYV